MDHSDTDQTIHISTTVVDTTADSAANYLAEAVDRAIDPNSPTAEDERFAVLVAVLLTLMLRLLLMTPGCSHANLEQFYAQLKAGLTDNETPDILH